MKKLFFLFLTLFLAAGVTFSQEDPEKALSKAGRALGSFNLDPANNGDKLKEAIESIEIAAKGEATKGKVKTWQTRGEIYNALADKDVNMFAIDQNHVPERPDAPLIAAESFKKALELAEKKFEIKDAVKGLQEAGNKLNVIGNSQIQRSDFEGAYKSLNMVLQANELIKKQGEDPILKDADIPNHKFVVAYTANASGNTAEAKRVYKELYEAGTEEPTVYAQYFNILQAEKDPDALKVLETGRNKFPDNTEILFAEINYYIASQQYEKLEEKLKLAIEKEPNNASVYSALGNVYMNLFTQEFEKDKKSAKAQEYFDKSLQYFNDAVRIDPKQFDAVYSIGSLYFNRAVELIKAAADLGMSPEDQKKYKEMEAESNKLMNTALPYFQKTEAMDPNDENTLIALSEIYARMNDFEKSKEFKTRLQNVRDGGKNESSYFKQ